MSGTQLVEQRLGLLEVRRGEALGKSVIDRSEKVDSLLSLAPFGQQPCKVSSSTQLDLTGFF